jgi:hypothetical protein
MRESIFEFMDRQNRRAARFGRDAETMAHEAYGKAIRAGKDLKLISPSDVMRHGAKLVQEYEDKAVKAVQKAKAQTRETVRQAGKNPIVRAIAIEGAREAGNLAGVVNGGVEAVKGLADGAVFAGRLVNPLDALMSPRGESAAEQLARGVVKTGEGAVDYVDRAVADPGIVERAVRDKARQWTRELVPGATPKAATFEGELRRNFEIGENQGEVAFDVGSLVVGGPAAKMVKGLPRVSNVGNVDRYLAQGFSPKAAAHLAKPYPMSNMGSHFIPRRTRLPEFLGGGPLPKSYSDSVFNVLKPEGISRGDFYELHYKVDPRFKGAKVIPGEGWSGKRLGLEEYEPVGRLWHGSPPPLKARVGGLGAAAGNGLHDEEGGLEW